MASGIVHSADLVILCTGAWTPSLLNLQNQCISKCWLIAHVEVTEEEAARYKGIPVVYNEEVGFCFEPIRVWEPATTVTTNAMAEAQGNDQKGRWKWVIKLSNEFPGATRYKNVKTWDSGEEGFEISVPRSHSDHPDGTLPIVGYCTLILYRMSTQYLINRTHFSTHIQTPYRKNFYNL